MTLNHDIENHEMKDKQGKSEGFDTCDQYSERICPLLPWNGTDDLDKQ